MAITDWRLTSIIAFVFAAGCASNVNHAPPLGPDEVHIQSVARPPDGLEIGYQQRLETTQAVKENTANGAVIGAAAMGAACVGLAAMGVVIGCLGPAAAGGAYGAAGGAAGSTKVVNPIDRYPPETRDRLTTLIKDAEDRHEFYVELRDSLRGEVPSEYQTDDASAKVPISTRPDSVKLVQNEKLELAIRIKATLAVEWHRNKRTPRSNRMHFVHTSAQLPVEDWLREGGSEFDDALTVGVAQITRDMEAWLATSMQ
jgi:hypothetical protein